jgi:pimeloyl-ACP methyl ester carboxylesterase
MRDYPEGIRSVILDSTYTPESNIYLDTPGNFERAFSTMVDGCNADLMCRLLYPDVRGVYIELFDNLNAAPVKLIVETPSQNLEIQVNGHLLAEVVRIALYSREGVQYLPAMLYNARNGDYALLKPVILLLMQITSSISEGTFFSVQCGEEAPFTTEQEVIDAASHVPAPFRGEMSLFSEFGFHLCGAWGMGAPDRLENQAVTSTIPTLILGGEFDPVTPPSNGETATKSLTQGYLFQFPGVSHGVTSELCPGSIALTFLDDPTRQPNSSCIADMRAPQFVVTTSATRPFATGFLLLLSGVALWGTATVAIAYLRQPRQVALYVSIRAVGWIPFLVSILTLMIFVKQGGDDTPFAWQDKARVVESIIPLVMCIQVALMFSPDDEPALEVLLACPRRISWLLLERLGIILSAHAGIALVGVALSLALNPEQDVTLAIVRWIPPAIFLSGIGVYTTVRSRVAAFGVTVAGLIWFGMILFGAALLPGQPIFWPLNYLQPFLWPANPYLQPGQLAIGDYWLNRAFVTAAGIGLIMLAVYYLRDEESILLGSRKGKSQ